MRGSLNSSSDLTTITSQAHQASLVLASLKGSDRSRALQCMANALQERQDDILEANTLDLETSREMAIPDIILEWLKLTPERLQTTIQILERLAELTDPTQQLLNTFHQVEQCQAFCQLMPLGVIALVYESFPELAAIAAGLCMRAGNSLILKGGNEASHSNQIMTDTLQLALEDASLPVTCVQLIPLDQGDATRNLVTQDQHVSLVIPYGRSSLVQQVMRQATVPVLKTAIGNCYLYWASSGELDVACWMILDSHQSEPDPVNAIEKVLIPQDFDSTLLIALFKALQEKGFELKGDAKLVSEFRELSLAQDDDWSHAYLKPTIAFKVVNGLDGAIEWINQYSSGHADCIVTESYYESRHFAANVGSATVYVNASPRFYRHPKRDSPVALGMSNQKGHRRGPISFDSLMTIKRIVQGNGCE
ncbi:MAG: glutamate-5-semialdehyde dehydrogenase [Elainellaceae cyanobacterium]